MGPMSNVTTTHKAFFRGSNTVALWFVLHVDVTAMTYD